MVERLTWDEIKRRYPDEWVLVVSIDEDATEAEIRSACVIFHSPDRDKADDAALSLPVPRHLGVFFTGVLVEPGLVPML